MVSFSNTDDAHCDSVNGQSTMPSETVQMNVKIPVQPSNFDALQMGALLGAPGFMKHGKNHTYQINNKTKSIPSPGTTIQSRLVSFARCNPDGHESEPDKTRCNAVTCA
ncbi:TPA: hypothetical protein MYQ41_001351 [Citrobacter amalonaticus]|nr:hypothetical protein [Citrobacter amalonaticus]